MRTARFRLHSARMDRAFREEATVFISRADDALFMVRPKRRRRLFALPLSVVAEMVVSRVVKAEVFAERVAKADARKARLSDRARGVTRPRKPVRG